MNKPVTDKMFLDDINYLHINVTVKALTSKTTDSFDEISFEIIKETISNVIYSLTDIINRSIITAIIPDQLKLTEVINV